MTNLQPTPIVDKNGKQTTVHKKPVTAASKRASAVPAPTKIGEIKLDRSYTHNTKTSGSGVVPVILEGGDIAPNDASNWHESTEEEYAVYETYWDHKSTAMDNGMSDSDASKHALGIMQAAEYERNVPVIESKTLTTAEAEAASREVPYVSSSKPERDAYYKAIGNIEAKWRLGLEEEYADGLSDAVKSEIFQKAWSDGHSSGYGEVENYYQRYADFANLIIKNS